MANLISLFRVILAFYLLLMLDYQSQNSTFYWTAVGLTLAVILLDALDGWVARKFNEASKIGSIIDILGDRIVENAYWNDLHMYCIINFLIRWGEVYGKTSKTYRQQGAKRKVYVQRNRAYLQRYAKARSRQ